MPGQIIQHMKRAGTKNPVFLLDEVDKISSDFRGDPASALLEVLDPEQTSPSRTTISTSTTTSRRFSSSPRPTCCTPFRPRCKTAWTFSACKATPSRKSLKSRGSTWLKTAEQTGLSEKNIVFKDDAILEIIRYYTREAGVRNLEREIGNVCRKVARKVVKAGNKHKEEISASNIVEFLGVPKFRDSEAHEKSEVGLLTGLAWTEVGGSILTTEVQVLDGKGKLTITGQLGDVMQESAQAALAYIRSKAHALGLSREFYRNVDLHLHVPEGAISKDGPSAGITMATALASALAKIPVRRDVAMTGEITLRGKVLPSAASKKNSSPLSAPESSRPFCPAPTRKISPSFPTTSRTP